MSRFKFTEMKNTLEYKKPSQGWKLCFGDSYKETIIIKSNRQMIELLGYRLSQVRFLYGPARTATTDPLISFRNPSADY